ncbi:hypothetical protein DFH27DRAFT_617816 [Peziza echinospora]|nr:hypothetical protein DFH27DRAFT_617816 [Peziza echinospora]
MADLCCERMDELNQKLRICDVSGLVNQIYTNHCAMGIVRKLRERSGYLEHEGNKSKDAEAKATAEKEVDAKSDTVFGNATLFISVVGLYSDLTKAIYEGDSGRIMFSMHYLTIMFQASGLGNYASELLELSVVLRREWSEPLKEVYYRNVLVNLSGKEDCWMELDSAQEHVARMVLDQFHPNGTMSSAKYLREVVSPNILSTKTIKEHVRHDLTGKKATGRAKMSEVRAQLASRNNAQPDDVRIRDDELDSDEGYVEELQEDRVDKMSYEEGDGASLDVNCQMGRTQGTESDSDEQ